MHIVGYLAEYWWALIVGIVLVVGTFVFVAGRGAEGGARGRAAKGWRKWRDVSERVANVQARVLLTVFYVSVMAPFGFWQAQIADRLGLRRPRGESFWLPRKTRDQTLADGRRQF